MNDVQSTIRGTDPDKPLGGTIYGRIPHLPGSRMTDDDRLLDKERARICCEHTRDANDLVIVQEKLDGSNVAVVKQDAQLVPLIRSGYRAAASKYEQHRLFHAWAFENFDRFNSLLADGERIVGEWLALAHGTRYALPHEPFVALDLFAGDTQAPLEALTRRASAHGFVTPRVIHRGKPISIDAVLRQLEPSGHGALDSVEGVVWRVERFGKVDFMAKFVRHEKRDGCYLAEQSGQKAIWNWRPS